MLELKSDYEDLQSQLEAIGYDPHSKSSAKIIDSMIGMCLTLAEYDLSESELATALSLMQPESRLVMGAWAQAHTGVLWSDFDYGNTKIGDYVRVKKDAYDSKSGETHNGLVGKLSHMRGGKCTVEYIGLGAGSTSYHPMNNLETIKLV